MPVSLSHPGHAHLKWPRVIMFTLVQWTAVVTGSLAAWALATGYDQKAFARRALNGAELHIQDAFATGGAVVAASGLSGLLCLFLSTVMILRRRDKETLKSIRMKEGAFAFILFFMTAALIPATIIMATRSGVITKTGVPQATINALLALQGTDTSYKHQKPIVAYVAVGWVCWLCTIIAFVLCSREARYIHLHGPDTGILAPSGGKAHDAHMSESPTNHSGRLSTEKERRDGLVEH